MVAKGHDGKPSHADLHTHSLYTALGHTTPHMVKDTTDNPILTVFVWEGNA